MRLLRAALLLVLLGSLPVFAQHPSGGGSSGPASSGGSSSSSPPSYSSSSGSSGGSSSGSSGGSSSSSSSHSSSSSSSSSTGSSGSSSSSSSGSYSRPSSSDHVDHQSGSRTANQPDFSRTSPDRQDHSRGTLDNKMFAKNDTKTTDRRDLDRSVTDQRARDQHGTVSSFVNPQVRVGQNADPKFEKKLNHEMNKFDSSQRKLASYVSKIEAQQQKQALKDRKIEEKREKAARKLEAKLHAIRPPRGPVKPLPVACTGKAGQGTCTCADGSRSNPTGQCGTGETQTAQLACPPGQFGIYADDRSGFCQSFVATHSASRNCDQLAEVLRRLEDQRKLLEHIVDDACSNDPAGGRCSDLSSDYRSLMGQRDALRLRYEACLRAP